MCESHTVYQLCGHIKIKTIVQCADIIDQLVAANLQVTCSRRLCDDVSDNVHIFPDVCEKCRENGVIGGLLDQQPHLKLDILQEWKKELESGPKTRTSKRRDHECDSNETDNLEVCDMESSSTSTPMSASTSIASSPKSVATTATSQGAAPTLASLKKRVAVLRARTEQLLSKLHPQESSQPGPPSE